MSNIQSYYHIIFATRWRQGVLIKDCRQSLFQFIVALCKKYNCTVLEINGVMDHIHLLVDVSPTLSIDAFVQLVKQESSDWLKTTAELRGFDGWCKDYAAFTLSNSNIDEVANFIAAQDGYHRNKTLQEELETVYGWYKLRLPEGEMDE